MQGVAIGYDWFYDAMSAAQRTVIEDGLYRAGLTEGTKCYHYNCTWVPGIEPVGNCSSCWWIRAMLGSCPLSRLKHVLLKTHGRLLYQCYHDILFATVLLCGHAATRTAAQDGTFSA